jgi:hypothetical protein
MSSVASAPQLAKPNTPEEVLIFWPRADQIASETGQADRFGIVFAITIHFHFAPSEAFRPRPSNE